MADGDEGELGVIEPLEEVLGGAVGRELQPQPREAIARPRRVAGQAGEGLRERAVAVLNADLGNRAEREPLHSLEAHRESQHRQDPRPEKLGQPVVGDDEREAPVRRAQQPARDRDPLVGVGVEQRRRRSA